MDIAATDTTPGSKHKECTTCGYVTQTEIIPATGAGHSHSYGSAWETDAANHWNECSCGEKNAVAAHTASGWIIDTPATASTPGSRHKECTVCSYVLETETIPATGAGHSHSYGSAWETDAANHWNECSCGEKNAVAAHTASGWIIDTPATASTPGSRHKECTVCGYVLETEIIPATGVGHSHSYGSAWETDTANHWNECSCGEKNAVAAHTASGWIIDTPATASTPGSRHKECTVCSYVLETETIPATGGSGGSGSGGSSSSGSSGAVNDISPEPWKNPFADIHEGQWFYNDVAFVHQNGLFVGTSAMIFDPHLPMTRGMVVTVLGRLAGIDIKEYGTASFDDVNLSMWYAPYVKWAAEMGIVKGVGNNSFAPDANITRQDLAVLLYNYAQKTGATLPETNELAVFSDAAEISDYATKAIESMQKAGIIRGLPDGSYAPESNASRAEVAAVLNRFVNAMQP